MAINLTSLDNGLLFDRSDVAGAGTTSAKYIFRPAHFHTILQVTVQDNFMTYITAEGREWYFDVNGVKGSLIEEINGVTLTDNYDLFNKFIELL